MKPELLIYHLIFIFWSQPQMYSVDQKKKQKRIGLAVSILSEYILQSTCAETRHNIAEVLERKPWLERKPSDRQTSTPILHREACFFDAALLLHQLLLSFHGSAVKLSSSSQQMSSFFYCNMPTVRPLSHGGITAKKLTSSCCIISPFTVRPLSHGDNNNRFDFHLLYYIIPLVKKEKENSCNFTSRLQKG